MTKPFTGSPQKQWGDLMELRGKAGLDRELVTRDDGSVGYVPAAQTMQDQERYEDPECFCRYCGFDPCECDRHIDMTDYTR